MHRFFLIIIISFLLPNILSAFEYTAYSRSHLNNNDNYNDADKRFKDPKEAMDYAVSKCSSYFKNRQHNCKIFMLTEWGEKEQTQKNFMKNSKLVLSYNKTLIFNKRTINLTSQVTNNIKLCIAIDDNSYFQLRDRNVDTSNCFSTAQHMKEISYKKLLANNPYMNLCYRPTYRTIFAVKTMNYSYANGWVKIIDGEWKNTNKECNQVFKDALVLNHIDGDSFTTKTLLAKKEKPEQVAQIKKKEKKQTTQIEKKDKKILKKKEINNKEQQTLLTMVSKKDLKINKSRKIEKIKIKKYSVNKSKLKKDEIDNKKITKENVEKLGSYERVSIDNLPKQLRIKNKVCKNQFCFEERSPKKVSMIFIQRGKKYHARNPGDIMHGMVWFEFLYQNQLRTNKKFIERYFKIKSQGKSYEDNIIYSGQKKRIISLIKMNEGREKMRQAMGLSLEDSLQEVINKNWIMGDYLNATKYKIKTNNISEGMVKRKKVIKKYNNYIKNYKKRLENQKLLN